MAGETIKTKSICLDIRPWSRTSHVVSWLTPTGRVATVVKGAVRAKSQFLGQYDLNYTCDIVYYARTKGELHALRECVPVEMREELRNDYRKLALAGYMRRLVAELAPMGEECRAWYGLLLSSLSSLVPRVDDLIRFELAVLRLSGLAPDFGRFGEIASASRGGRDGTGDGCCDGTGDGDRNGTGGEWLPFSIETGNFGNGEGRCVRVSRETAEYLANGAQNAKNLQIPLDAARVIGVFYQFHLDCAADVRRTVLEMISNQGR